MTCTICQATIHPARREAQPRAITCSRQCSETHKRNLRRINAKRQYERKKANKN